MDKPILTLTEVNYLVRCAKKDTRLAKILSKLHDDDSFEIEIILFDESVADESEEW